MGTRHCQFHDGEVIALKYHYPVPGKLAPNNEGWLLCPECVAHLEKGDIAYFREAVDAAKRPRRRKVAP